MKQWEVTGIRSEKFTQPIFSGPNGEVQYGSPTTEISYAVRFSVTVEAKTFEEAFYKSRTLLKDCTIHSLIYVRDA
jgi:hypothetical protein